MKKKLLIGLSCILLSGTAYAQSAQQFRYNYTLATYVPYDWQDTTPTYTDWVNSGSVYDCRNWSPATSTYGKGTAFTQTATDCKQDQERFMQNRHQDSRTGIYENVGDPIKESQVIAGTDSRSAIGILENWASIDPTYTSWQDTNALYGCSAWSPDPSLYSANASFTQTSNACSTDQERERQEREKELYTAEIRNSGAPITESQTLANQAANRPYSVTLGQWKNDGELYSCSNWSPDPSTVGKDIAFQQSATDCKMNQLRTRTEAYIDHKTGSKVNVPRANEVQILSNQSNSRDAKGTREDWVATDSIYGAWTNTPGMVQYSCSNWSPSPASKTTAGTFVQTASDCKTDQTRTRQDQELESNTKVVRNKGNLVTEKQTLSGQGATRNYTVSLSAWANNGSLTSCTNWSPDPATITINQAFTQTATDCQQPQKRTRSESYVDHLSGATVPVSAVTQNQSITASDTRSATGTKETWVASTSVYSAWSNTSAIDGCSAWSPSPASYTVRTQFTQTGTGCSVSQSRTRQDQQKETTTGAIRNNGAVVTETQTAGGQTTTRSYLMDFNAWADSGGYYGCTAWTPDASTVASGTAFTQSANCNINQVRGAAGYTLVNGAWSPDPAVPYRTESTAIVRAVTQAATGTKVMEECPPASSTNRFWLKVTQQSDIPMATWNGSIIPNFTTSKYATLSVSYGGYYYHNDTVTGAGLRGGTNYQICRRPL